MKPVFPSIAASARARYRAPSWALVAAAIAALPGIGRAASEAQGPPVAARDTALTIYSASRPGGVPVEFYRPVPGRGAFAGADVPGYAMVRDDRRIPLAAGHSTVRFTDVAALIDPTTVTFASLSDPATRVTEQNFQFDLVSQQKLLQRFIDRTVTVERGQNGPPVQGTLLSVGDGLVVRAADGSLTALHQYDAVRFPELPGGLITRPTLEWDVDSPRAGEHRARVSYQTGGLTWWADYNLLFTPGRDASTGTVDLSAWVSIINRSGASFPDARLKLIAGDVHRAPSAAPAVKFALARAAATDRPDGFEEKAFDEFHLYTLGRRTTLANDSTQQIELFDAVRAVPARRLLEYRDGTQVRALLEFRNDAAAGLGVPLPAGRLRVSRLDPADGSLEFIGEDVIDHTPRGETVRIQLGNAFDVVGERKLVDSVTDSAGRTAEEAFEIQLRNHKDEDVEVRVREGLYRWANWRIVGNSLPYRKEDARDVSFEVKVPRNGAATLRYRVRYSW